MQFQKLCIILFGITGDLSKRKIIPSIGVLSNLYENIEIELVGYSRSKPEVTEIENLLNLNQQHKLKSIKFIQAEYTDAKLLQELVINKIKDKYYLIFYLAVPPFLFQEIIKNLCIFGQDKLSIVMEKPFGEDLKEAKKILQNIKNCKLTKNVKFFDHYLFKDGININSKLINKYIKNPYQIEIKAKEFISIEGRERYYEKIGAIKDMLPSHLYSLTKKTYLILNLDFCIKNLQITNLEIAQYKDYAMHSQNPHSKIETYFNIKFLDTKNKIKLTIESGKKLEKKETSITVINNKGKLYWEIHPNPQIKTKNTTHFINKTNMPEHTKMFSYLIENKTENFLTKKEIIEGWKLYNLVEKYIIQNKPILNKY